MSLATSDDSSTLLFAVVDIAHDSLSLNLRNLRTLVGVGVEGVSDLELGGLLLEGLDKLIIDRLLDVDSRTGTL